MKILVVTHSLTNADGWGTYSANMVRALRGLGHEVDVLTLRNPLEYLGRNLFFFLMQDVARLRAHIKKSNPDIVHSFAEPYTALFGFISKREHEKRLVTIHGTYATYPIHATSLTKPFLTWLFSRGMKSIDAVVSVSKGTRVAFEQEMKNLNILVPRIEVIHVGVVIGPLQSRVSSKSSFVVLSVGGVKPRKGILEIIQGLGEFKRRHTISFEYRIIGSLEGTDAYVGDLKRTVKECNLATHVVFLGKIEGSKLQDEFSQAHVLALLPRISGNDREGFGIVYLEANAYDVPALGARGTVSEEAIVEGKTGLIVDADSPSAIADGLYKIYEGSIPKGGPRAWAEDHAWERIVLQYEKLYSSLN